MLFINEKLGTELSVIEEDGQLFFDLEQIARNLGVKRVKSTVSQYIRRNGIKLQSPSVTPILTDNKSHSSTIVLESDAYLYIMQSKSPNARPFQRWVCEEVLPTIRKMGWNNIKKYQVCLALRKNPDLPMEELVKLTGDKDLVMEVLDEGNYYKTLGYMAPSYTNLGCQKFRQVAKVYGYLDAYGVATSKAKVREFKRDHKVYNGEPWYAWHPDTIAEIEELAAEQDLLAEPEEEDETCPIPGCREL